MIITLIGFAIVITFSYQFNFLIYIYLLPLLTVQLLLIIALSCFLSVTNAYLPDIQKFVLYGIRLLFYLSPVLYDSSRVLNSDKVPIFAKTVFQCNPFASLLPAYRDVLIRGLVPDMEIILIWFGIAVILLQLGVMLVRNQRNYIPKLI
jgi:ABC-type polysaccharide/polyol phosphate export permease